MASRRALERARSLVGTRFRPQGRDPASGLDCVGLVIAAFRLRPADFPDDYRFGGRGRGGELVAEVERVFRRVPRGAPGNLVLLRVGRDQMHLGIVAPKGAVHADARRGRVAEGALPAAAQIVGYFRQRRTALAKGARKWRR